MSEVTNFKGLGCIEIENYDAILISIRNLKLNCLIQNLKISDKLLKNSKNLVVIRFYIRFDWV